MLKNLKVHGFKSIKEMDLELRNINILIGANGSGKSNLLDVFDFLGAIYNCKLKAFVKSRTVDRLLFYGSKNTDKIDVEFTLLPDIGFEYGYKITLIPQSNTTSDDESKTLVIDKECIISNKLYSDEEPRVYEICQYEPESKLIEVKNKITRFRSISLHLCCSRKYVFGSVGAQRRLKNMCKAKDNRLFCHNGRNLPAFLRMLHDKYHESYVQIRDVVRLFYPIFDDFWFREIQHENEFVILEWKDKICPEYIFTVRDMSEGIIRFICLATLLLQPFELMPSTIIIDEPELGLHPAALGILSELIKSVSLQKQVIISTHSVELLDYFDYKDLVVCQRDRQTGESKFKRVENSEFLQECLKDMSLSEVWNSNFLGGRP